MRLIYMILFLYSYIPQNENESVFISYKNGIRIDEKLVDINKRFRNN